MIRPKKPTLPNSVRIHTTSDNIKGINHRPLEQGLWVLTDIISQLFEMELNRKHIYMEEI